MRYRRTRVDGGAYFFTVNLAERRPSLLVDYIDVLRKVVGMVKERHPFTIDAVILPQHLHAVWTLPPGDADYSRPGCSSKQDSRGISPKRNAGAPATGAARRESMMLLGFVPHPNLRADFLSQVRSECIF